MRCIVRRPAGRPGVQIRRKSLQAWLHRADQDVHGRNAHCNGRHSIHTPPNELIQRVSPPNSIRVATREASPEVQKDASGSKIQPGQIQPEGKQNPEAKLITKRNRKSKNRHFSKNCCNLTDSTLRGTHTPSGSSRSARDLRCVLGIRKKGLGLRTKGLGLRT